MLDGTIYQPRASAVHEGMSIAEIAAIWRKTGDTACLPLLRSRLLLPISRFEKSRAPETVRLTVAPFWDRISANGPFSWVYQIEHQLARQIGARHCHERTLRFGNVQTWLSLRLVARGISNGWIPWKNGTTPTISDLEAFTFPLTSDWVVSIADRSDVINPSQLLDAIFKESVEAGFPISYPDGRAVIHKCLQDGLVRLPDVRINDLLPAQAPSLSSHCKIEMIARLGSSKSITFPDGKLMTTIMRLAQRRGTETPSSFQKTVLGLSLAIAEGLVPSAPDPIQADCCQYWSS